MDHAMTHIARKRFGQHFLTNPRIIEQIHRAVSARPGEHLVEIGPGRGAITCGLLEATKELDVIELDRDLIAPLADHLAGLGTLRIHQADALRFDLTTLMKGAPGGLRLIGNLPYNISTPLLFHFIEQLACLRDMHLMLQKEVVERIIASPGTKAYGRLSVMVQSHCRAEALFDIPPTAFSPPPKVHSAFIRLRPRSDRQDLILNPSWHGLVVAAAFGQRRKTLRNSLKGLVMAEQLSDLGIDPGLRAENLDVESFARIANRLPPCDAPRIA